MRSRYSVQMMCLFVIATTAYGGSPLDMEFSNTPTQEEYNALVQPIVNAGRFMFVGPGQVSGEFIEISASQGFATVPAETVDASAGLLANGSQLDGGTFTQQRGLVRIYAPGGAKDAHPGLALTAGQMTGSNLSFWGFAGTFDGDVGLFWPGNALSLRVGYTELMGVASLSACTTSAEMALTVLPLFGFFDLYLGTGTSAAGAVSVANLDSEITSSWVDTYSLLGAELRPLRLLSFGKLTLVEAGVEVSRSLKSQTTAMVKAAFVL